MVKDDAKAQPPFFPSYSLGVVSVSAFLGYVIFNLNIRLQGEGTQFAKFLFALRWQVLSGLTLLANIVSVGRARNTRQALDPLAPESQPKIDSLSRQLQNTMEQFLLNAVGQLVLSTYLEPQNLRVIPGLVLLFVTGRILFFMGYPDQRGPGFMMTFFPTIATYLANVYFLVTSGSLYRL